MKHFFTFLAFDFIISLFYTIIRDFSQYSFINSVFFIGMIYLLFGALCFVWERGFFNVTIFSFNKINQQIQKKRGVLTEDTNLTLDDYICRTNHFYLTNSLLCCGAFISFVSIIVSFMYL
ncbi:DUF3899 domain-containing protein [Romboutsia sp.]|uniref:DUF3899 domain-containing protein n=1 Tax=Romboutsia sp. TaxID=1965302 RepID=UPI003F32E9F5